uniref:Uncharacterized protein n=1 Tax=Avena sativa TaxID=4498 RepID=A0ACD5V8B3_AVESA
MAPPGNSADPKSAKKGKKSSSKDERKHRKDKHERPSAAADEAPLHSSEAKRKRKGGKEHGKKPKKAEAETEATGGGEAKRGQDKMKRAMEDERFAGARTDPRFRPMRRKEAKVALDSRFDGMLTNPMFASSEAPVDKRGRRRKKNAMENPMLHYYLNQEEGDPKKEKKEKKKLIREEDDDDEPEEEDEQDEEESSSSSDDEEEEEVDDDQYSIGSDIAHYLMARHDDTPMTDKETHRLAVVNMDWDHIKAVDLYMVMTSCVPKGGRVLSVSVYPSEFGLECMNIETTQGPSALIGADEDEDDGVDGGEDDNDEYDDGGDGGEDDDDDSDDVDGEEDSEHDSETENNRLRAYELNKLRYYHAVVVCDSSATANHLYTTLDGTEFLKTANVFDLQFIPDSMEFKRAARDEATEAPPSYKEPDFETRALQHSKVNPTWDDDEPDRKKILRRKFKEDQLDDLGIFLASDDSSSDDGSDDESLPNGVAKRKLTHKERLALLLEGDKSDEEQNDDQDMEITFNTELEDLSKRILERKSTEKKTVWEMHQEKMKEKRKARKRSSKDDDESSDEDSADESGDKDSADEKDDFFEDEKSDEEVKPVKKQKVKAKGKGKAKLSKEEHFEPEATKEELELLVAADQDAANGAKGYNIKRKSKKGKKGKDSVEDKVPEIDLSTDPRFSQMFTSHLYAMDPTDPQYKRSATFVRKQVGKKTARAATLDTEPPVEEPSLGNTLPPDDASSKNPNRKHDGASTEKLQMMSAVNSLKRNLSAFKKASKSDR